MNEVLEQNVELNQERETQEQICFDQPELFEVHLHNDDFKRMGFVIKELIEFFKMDDRKAKTVTIEAHTKGRAVCGVYNKDIAATRIDRAAEHARTHDHPLRWSMQAA